MCILHVRYISYICIDFQSSVNLCFTLPKYVQRTFYFCKRRLAYVGVNFCCTRFKSWFVLVSFHLLVVKALQGNKKLPEFDSQLLYGPPFSIIIISVRIPDPAVHHQKTTVRQNFWYKTYFLLKLKTHSLSGQKTETLSEGWNSGAGGRGLSFLWSIRMRSVLEIDSQWQKCRPETESRWTPRCSSC